ncbi:unnamed protein product [Adineta steineri]|uniref:Uncharacterized protein n=1 Tax=Adineta steineri TaxID=433720 RepID=A0A813MDQ8_9BILA|nr:unnamed protein product [Adineta steineri]CAF0732292.1 unnamed protein product [Adineta steineri]CAF0740573.1 unnamed protein product [Adineta steineri]CAF0750520.1 unnamed protein product [Adineta steineri]CAF0762168.1 unnamed protein product [Adineta steineri]
MNYGYGVPPPPKKLREKIWSFEGEWQRDICGCFHNLSGCLCAYFCCPCFCYSVFNRSGEWLCAPFMCCWPDSLLALRTKMRTGFRLQGSVFKDCMAATCCPCCLLVQIDSELEYQGL